MEKLADVDNYKLKWTLDSLVLHDHLMLTIIKLCITVTVMRTVNKMQLLMEGVIINGTMEGFLR